MPALGMKKWSLKMAEKKVKKETTTHFNYNRLWKLLIDRGIKKGIAKKVTLVLLPLQKWVDVKKSLRMCYSEYVRHLIIMLRI